MSGLVIAACVIAGVALYLFICLRYAAPRYVTREVARCLSDYPCLSQDAREIARWRRSAAGEAWGPAIIWPLYLLCVVLKPTAWIARHAPLTDVEAKAEIRKRDQRIAQLEREAGIR